MMEFMSDNKQKMDAIMIQMGPQGDQAREMGVIKQALKESDEKNDARFKKLEDTVYKNKQQKEVRFEEHAKNKDKKRTFEEVGESGDNDMGGASGAGSSNEGGFLEVLGLIPRAGGWSLKGVRVLRIVRIVATLGVRVDRVRVVRRPRAVGCGRRAPGGSSRRRSSRSRPEW